MLLRPISFRSASLVLALAVSAPANAFVPPEKAPGVAGKAFSDPSLEIRDEFRRPTDLEESQAAAALQRLETLGIPARSARIDARSGRFATLLAARPLLPGSGVGNNLSWSDLRRAAPASDAEVAEGAREAFLDFLAERSSALGIDVAELGTARVTVQENGDLIQIWVPRVVQGLPVRGSYLTAVVRFGNLVLFGAERWGAAPASLDVAWNLEEARARVAEHLAPLTSAGEWGRPERLMLPTSAESFRSGVDVGGGYDLRPVWAVRPSVADDHGHWEALVDAATGALLSFSDTNHYAEVRGGVLPVSNDGVDPDGVEQPEWPMPYLTVQTGSGSATADTGGNVTDAGEITGSLEGTYVRMSDNCGAISLTQTNGLDFGTSGGTDCTTPGFGGAGNTHSSRTGFYELNKLIEMGRGQLPGNTWLQQQLTANMNINQSCNAFWSNLDGTVNFYRSGGGCSNTGEIAGVFDHEWGHGLDANDAAPGISSPSGEGIADLYMALRLNTSCIGRNFRAIVCDGFGDPCLTCTGVRDIDYLERQSGNPHTFTWSNANCGGSVHCVGSVYAEAVWSLWKRILQAAPYGYDNNTAQEVVTRLTFLGGGNVGTWFSGSPPFGGCAATGGYLNFLAADDDNGNLEDGTPHMGAIYEAFNDQEIACDSPAVQDSGCTGTPSMAPGNLALTPGNKRLDLSWNSVTGATEYHVFRTEGVFGCDFGKVNLGSTTNTTWEDTGLQNGREYSYIVVPKGPSDSCFGPASSCATDNPVGAPDFVVGCSPSSFTLQPGESDTTTCTVTSEFAYVGDVDLACTGLPAGISCEFDPESVSVSADGTVESTLTVTVGGAVATGSYDFDVAGDDGARISRSTGIGVQVIPLGSNGPQDAIFDGGLGVPRCDTPGSTCESGDLLVGRGTVSPAESNQPNTLDGCTDGTSGTYHSDESNDALVVATLDGGNFTEGDTVEVRATVWAWSTGSSDTLDLYYAADANAPVWNLIGSVDPPGGGAQTLTAQYTLPAGALQAVRANFRYQGSQSPCSGGDYDDADDIVFAVEPPGGGPNIFDDGFESGDTSAW